MKTINKKTGRKAAPKRAKRKAIQQSAPKSVEELDQRFDDGESILEHMDLSKAVRLRDLPPKRVNVDFPVWMVNWLDWESKRQGISRQALIKVLITERIDRANRQDKTT